MSENTEPKSSGEAAAAQQPVAVEDPRHLLEQAVEGSGVTVAFRKELADGVALGIRVPPAAGPAWKEFIEVATFRAAAAVVNVPDGEEAPYSLEVSKVFYYDAEKDSTVWMWRVVGRGDLKEIVSLLSRQDFLRPRMILTSFPVHGRTVGRPDSLKGVHQVGVGEGYVARAAARKPE